MFDYLIEFNDALENKTIKAVKEIRIVDGIYTFWLGDVLKYSVSANRVQSVEIIMD